MPNFGLGRNEGLFHMNQRGKECQGKAEQYTKTLGEVTLQGNKRLDCEECHGKNRELF